MVTLPPDYWLLGRDEFVQRATRFCNRLLKDLIERYDTKYQELNPRTGADFKEPDLFRMDLEHEHYEEFVDQVSYREVFGKAKADRFAALSGASLQQED